MLGKNGTDYQFTMNRSALPLHRLQASQLSSQTKLHSLKGFSTSVTHVVHVRLFLAPFSIIES